MKLRKSLAAIVLVSLATVATQAEGQGAAKDTASIQPDTIIERLKAESRSLQAQTAARISLLSDSVRIATQEIAAATAQLRSTQNTAAQVVVLKRAADALDRRLNVIERRDSVARVTTNQEAALTYVIAERALVELGRRSEKLQLTTTGFLAGLDYGELANPTTFSEFASVTQRLSSLWEAKQRPAFEFAVDWIRRSVRTAPYVDPLLNLLFGARVDKQSRDAFRAAGDTLLCIVVLSRDVVSKMEEIRRTTRDVSIRSDSLAKLAGEQRDELYAAFGYSPARTGVGFELFLENRRQGAPVDAFSGAQASVLRIFSTLGRLAQSETELASQAASLATQIARISSAVAVPDGCSSQLSQFQTRYAKADSSSLRPFRTALNELARGGSALDLAVRRAR